MRGRTSILCGKHYLVGYVNFRQISRDISIFLSFLCCRGAYITGYFAIPGINAEQPWALISGHEGRFFGGMWDFQEHHTLHTLSSTFKVTFMQENEDYCLESYQQSEDPKHQDIGHMYSLDSFGDVYHFSRFAQIFVLLPPFVLTFGMRGFYNELKSHDFT